MVTYKQDLIYTPALTAQGMNAGTWPLVPLNASSVRPVLGSLRSHYSPGFERAVDGPRSGTSSVLNH